MPIPVKLDRRISGERGVVLIVVLIIAGIFAVLAYTTLAVSIKSLESTDTHRHSFVARQVAEGAMHEGAYGLLVDPEYITPGYIDPFEVSTTSEDLLKVTLLTEGVSYEEEIEDFPVTTLRTAYSVDTSISAYYPETDIVPGDRDNAIYRYHDDLTFSEDFPGYEFAQRQSTGDLVVFGVGEVDEPDGDTALFSFLRGEYPNVQWNYDVREAGITESSRLGPYPYIQTEHPYPPDIARAWSVTYQQDPRHPYRNLTHLALMAKIGRVQIHGGDTLYISPWLAGAGQFQNPPPQSHSGFENVLSEVFTDYFLTTTIGLYLSARPAPPADGLDYGFRVSGVRYKFDYDAFPSYYETPHPYDHIIDVTTAANLNVMVIHGEFQAAPASPMAVAQQMTIQFSDFCSLDPADTLYLFNASEPMGVGAVEVYDSGNPLPPGGFSPVINRMDTTVPLGFVLLLHRGANFDTDGLPDYGFKIEAMEYTDRNGNWQRREQPLVQTPHLASLGANDGTYTIPDMGGPLYLPLTTNIGGYMTIWQPSVPDTTDPSGLGTLTNWKVYFSECTNLTVGSGGPLNNDMISLTIAGFTINYVHEDSFWGPFIISNPLQYRDIRTLSVDPIDCGIFDRLEIEFISDAQDAHEVSPENFGYRIDAIEYTTSDGHDDDSTPPTIRSDVYYPSNVSYPAFGDQAFETSEWWYTNKNALVVGLHFDRYSYDLDPGDRIEVYDIDGILIATLVSDSTDDFPDMGGPGNPDDPTGGEQPGGGPGAAGPEYPLGTSPETVIDLNATYGWVLVPGTTAQVKLIGDGDDNAGHSGFEINHCGYVNGDILQVKEYYEEYAMLAYDQYYDRSDDPTRAFRFRNLGGY